MKRIEYKESQGALHCVYEADNVTVTFSIPKDIVAQGKGAIQSFVHANGPREVEELRKRQEEARRLAETHVDETAVEVSISIMHDSKRLKGCILPGHHHLNVRLISPKRHAGEHSESPTNWASSMTAYRIKKLRTKDNRTVYAPETVERAKDILVTMYTFSIERQHRKKVQQLARALTNTRTP